MPAMIGGQHHRIVDPRCVHPREEIAELAVEAEHLDAHFRALGAGRMADIVGRRKAEDQQIGLRALSQSPRLAQRRPRRQHRAIGLGRGKELSEVHRLAATGPGEPTGADGAAAADIDSVILSGAHRWQVERRTWAGNRPTDGGGNLCNVGRRFDAAIAGEPGGRQPPQLVGLPPAHHDRSAVLAGHRDDLRARIGGAHQIAQRRHTQILDRRRIAARARRRAGNSRILRTIDALVIARDAKIEPVVGDHAVAPRMRSGQDGRMAGAGFGRGMRLIARGKHHARCQPREAASEMLAILAEQIGGKLIDRYRDDQLGRGCRGKRSRRHRSLLRCRRSRAERRE